MSGYRSSFRKTTLAAGTAALAAVVLTSAVLGLAVSLADGGSILWPVLAGVVALTGFMATIWLVLIAAGGLIALHRDALEAQGLPYADSARREWVPAPFFVTLWSWLRRSRPRGADPGRLQLYPGELVQVRSLDEILATLDENGTCNGLPFMPEMAAYCGSRARVFRRVEKLNDWVHGTGIRRVRNVVLLEGLRCNGSAHGGCQASCHLRWCEAWLCRVNSSDARTVPAIQAHTNGVDLNRFVTRPGDGAEQRYVCQATQLAVGAPPLHPRDPRIYVRELLVGNLRLKPLLTGLALACFNWLQSRRGGVGFPVYQVGASSQSPHETLDLQVGERVRVRPKSQIEPTLNNRSRNRGLYFDREMLRFCGGEYRVEARVERVIVEKTGELRLLANPCIILQGVTASGEYNGFNPENECIFWREIWLERAGSRAVAAVKPSAIEP